MLKVSELREKTMDELTEEVRSLSEKLFKYRMELATGQLTDPSKIKHARRDLARVKTTIRQKQLNLK